MSSYLDIERGGDPERECGERDLGGEIDRERREDFALGDLLHVDLHQYIFRAIKVKQFQFPYSKH